MIGATVTTAVTVTAYRSCRFVLKHLGLQLLQDTAVDLWPLLRLFRLPSLTVVTVDERLQLLRLCHGERLSVGAVVVRGRLGVDVVGATRSRPFPRWTLPLSRRLAEEQLLAPACGVGAQSSRHTRIHVCTERPLAIRVELIASAVLQQRLLRQLHVLGRLPVRVVVGARPLSARRCRL
jgi:hypothetical protein